MRINAKILYAICFLVLGFSPSAFADSERDIAIDQAIAGMEEGSRMLAPDSLEMPGAALSPTADTKVIISPAAQKEIVSPGIETQGGSLSGGAVSGPQEITGGTTEDAGSGTVDVGVNPGGDQLLDVDVAGPEIDADAGAQEPGTETADHIIDVDAGVDTDSGTVEADVGVNPEGDQLLDADVIGSQVDADVTGSGLESETQIDIGGAVDISVEDDIGDPEEPADETSPVIDIDVSADLDSGTIDADVGVNPGGDQLLDADAGGTGADTTGAVEADIGSTSDVIEPDSTLVAEPVVVAPPAGLSAEVDTTGETVGGETDVGIEADVSGTGAGEDIVDDPTDDGVGGL
jgi:hypothetical protein